MGLLALGYYVGREIGRGEPIRKELKDWRDDETRKQIHTQVHTPPPSAEDSKR